MFLLKIFQINFKIIVSKVTKKSKTSKISN